MKPVMEPVTEPVAAVRPENRRISLNLLVFAGGGVLLVILLALSLTQGELHIPLRTVYEAIVHPQNIAEHQTIRGLRLPRAVMGILAGAALAAAGALLQTVTRNALAEAGTFGINAGAYFAVVLCTIFMPSLIHSSPLITALLGGCLGAGLSYLLAGASRSTPVRMALSGMIVSLVLASFTGALQLLFENETNGLFVWGSGSLNQNDWHGAAYSWPWVTSVLVLAWLFRRQLDLLEMGDETAQALGQRVGLARTAALSAAVLLAGVTVSVVGPIGFVGLIAPHLIRLLGMRRHALLIPGSALWGAVILLGADAIARLFRGTLGELPAGAVTALFGAPWLIWLALRASRTAAADGGGGMSAGVLHKRPPYPLLLAAMIVLILLASVIGISAGSLRIPLGDTLAVLSGGGEAMYRNIILDMRLPRLLVSLLAGAGLAVAGVMLQSTVRNPLADASVVGVTSGAGVGALLLIVLFPAASGGWLPAAAIVGAVGAAAVVGVLSWRKGLETSTLTLVGIAVSAACAAAIQFLVIRSGMGAAPALAWLAGTVYARGWSDLIRLAALLIVLLPAAWLIGRRADLLGFGDAVSQGLGLALTRARLLTALIGVLIAAAVVQAVGTVGFVGLLAPHAVRLLTGHHTRRAVVLSALLGGLLMVVSDIVGRLLIAPKEIPVGLVAAVIGTPYLLFLMFRSNRLRK